jgi:hypothetical protein
MGHNLGYNPRTTTQIGAIYELEDGTILSIPNHLISKVTMNKEATALSIHYSIPPCIITITGKQLKEIFESTVKGEVGIISKGRSINSIYASIEITKVIIKNEEF